jgi:hypothetical protein
MSVESVREHSEGSQRFDLKEVTLFVKTRKAIKHLLSEE